MTEDERRQEILQLQADIFERIFTEEEIEEYNSDVQRRIFGHHFITKELPGDKTAITDMGGFFLTHDEVEILISRIRNFYAAVTTSDIYILNMRTSDNRDTKPMPIARPGYVYLLDTNGGAPYKIGITRRNPKQRLVEVRKELSGPTGLSDEIGLRAFVFVNDPDSYEAALHKRYAPVRMSGEWFDLTEQHLSEIEQEFDDLAEQFNG